MAFHLIRSTMNPVHAGPVGHFLDAHGRSAFRVFAPEARAVRVLPEGGAALTLQPGALQGWHEGHAEAAWPEGTTYWLEVDGRRLPDPASRRQPQGVHGPSAIAQVRPPHSPLWRGVPIEDAVIYELHVGTFTPEGTLAAATAKLDHLRDLGVTVVELMPLAAFPGERNWGYDGVYLYALQASYGTWDDLRAFLEAAHARGLAVILDVVFNHFGPEGHYGGAIAPFTMAAATPWGAAINFHGAGSHGIRAFFLECLRFWLEDVGFDGVRMDAVSVIVDLSPVNILRAFTDLAREVGERQGRTILTIAEHLRNDRHVTAPEGIGYDSQWNDDLAHAVFALLTGETWRHYRNFGGFDEVVKALQDGFVMDGSRYCHVNGCYTGTDGRGTPGTHHVVHVQNHDQVGNRLTGDRLIATYGRAKGLLALVTMLASRYVPMLWMGEEWGETAPFQFFEDFSDPLIIEGAREGRKRDFAFHGETPPDPHDRATFLASKLQWQMLDTPEGHATLSLVRGLLALKRSGTLGPRDGRRVSVHGDPLTRLIRIETDRSLTLLNYADEAVAWPAGAGAAQGWRPVLHSLRALGAGERPVMLEAHAAVVCLRD